MLATFPEGETCTIATDQISCVCPSVPDLDASFSEITFAVGTAAVQAKLVMKGSSYMTYDAGNSVCLSNFKSLPELVDENYWLMGLPTYRSFEILHDMATNQMGFKALANSEVGPTTDLYEAGAAGAGWISVSTAAVFLGVSSVLY